MNNLQQHFLPYELSKEFKELGWDGYIFGVYLNKGQLFRQVMGLKNYPPEIYPDVVNAILWQQALEFLREKYGYHVSLGFDSWATEKYDFTINKKGEPEFCYEEINFDSYEQAQLAGIKHAVELIKQRK